MDVPQPPDYKRPDLRVKEVQESTKELCYKVFNGEATREQARELLGRWTDQVGITAPRIVKTDVERIELLAKQRFIHSILEYTNMSPSQVFALLEERYTNRHTR